MLYGLITEVINAFFVAIFGIDRFICFFSAYSRFYEGARNFAKLLKEIGC
jgi:hypothetical protein